MPSSKDRHRVELPSNVYERLRLMAESEERTLTSLLVELLQSALPTYTPTWTRFFKARLDEHARLALGLAKDEAERLGHSYVGTEHLLLGLLRVEEGIAAQVLHQLWIDLEQMRRGVTYITKLGTQRVAPPTIGVNQPPLVTGSPEGDVGFTPRARK